MVVSSMYSILSDVLFNNCIFVIHSSLYLKKTSIFLVTSSINDFIYKHIDFFRITDKRVARA